MADIIDLKATDLAAMLCSRVCHDLINPIGAIGNGLEVLGDPAQTEMADGARDLIASAARQSRAKLEFARLAYGASSTSGTDIDTRECERGFVDARGIQPFYTGLLARMTDMDIAIGIENDVFYFTATPQVAAEVTEEPVQSV